MGNLGINLASLLASRLTRSLARSPLVANRTRCDARSVPDGTQTRRRLPMPNYLSPGVYVEEVEAGSRPIEGVGTATAAFVGLAEKGPANAPTLVTNRSQFAQTLGGFIHGSSLAQSADR